MNTSVLGSVGLASICLMTLTTTSAVWSMDNSGALPVDLQIPDEATFGAELLNKQYDQGYVRNDNLTAHGTAAIRIWDIGLAADGYMAVGNDRTQPNAVQSGTTTELRFTADYLIEMENWFQLLPHINWIDYPNTSRTDYPLHDRQTYLGLDGWFLLPFPGAEVGAGVDYDPFWNEEQNRSVAGGGLSGHLLAAALGSRYFYQRSGVDLEFWGVLNFGNSIYQENFSGAPVRGVSTLDLGIKYTSAFVFDNVWTVARLELHSWLDKTNRTAVSAQGRDPNDWIIGFGFEYMPKL
jgi:hypothetical protein